MSESTQELKSAVEGAYEMLGEAVNLTDQLRGYATELADEADSHGWHAMANRMRDVGEALESTSEQLAKGAAACGSVVEELGLITDEIPADAVVAHLTVSTAQLNEVQTAVQAAVEKSEEAEAAAAEIQQEGMMQATMELHGQLTDLSEQMEMHRARSEEERAVADTYAKGTLGNP